MGFSLFTLISKECYISQASIIRLCKKLSTVAVLISQYCNSQQVHYIVDELANSKIMMQNPDGVFLHKIEAAARLFRATAPF